MATASENAPRWFVFVDRSYGYLGKCLTTPEEIAATLRNYSIEGNTVTVSSATRAA